MKLATMEALNAALDRLLIAHTRMVRCEIDAACCATAYDHNRALEARSTFEDEREKFEELLRIVREASADGA